VDSPSAAALTLHTPAWIDAQPRACCGPPSAPRRRRTKRWEAHIWAEKKQVYLGGFTDESRAGAAHDVMAIKCRGRRAAFLTGCRIAFFEC